MMKCIAVTPEKTVFEQEATFVVIPLYDGEYGVDANHSPVVGRIGAGELRLTLPDKSVKRWFVEGGFAEVVNDVVTLLVDRVYSYDDLDVATVQKELDVARAKPSNSPELAEIKSVAVERLRAKLRSAEKAASVSSR